VTYYLLWTKLESGQNWRPTHSPNPALSTHVTFLFNHCPSLLKRPKKKPPIELLVLGLIFGFLFFPMCSNFVLIKFPIGSERVPHSISLCPICFDQCCPLGTNKPGCILGLIRFCVFQANRYFYIGKSPKFHDFFLWWANKRTSLEKNINLKGTTTNFSVEEFWEISVLKILHNLSYGRSSLNNWFCIILCMAVFGQFQK